jgi:hypothetical protein
VKAITLWQPWASLLACGAKQFETRSWATKFRGQIAIHAAKKPVPLDFGFITRIPESIIADALGIHRPADIESDRDFWRRCIDDDYYGAIIATAELVGCHIMSEERGHIHIYVGGKEPPGSQAPDFYYPTEQEELFGDWTPGRFAWEFANMTMLPEPIPTRGRQGLWNWDG